MYFVQCTHIVCYTVFYVTFLELIAMYCIETLYLYIILFLCKSRILLFNSINIYNDDKVRIDIFLYLAYVL